ncbi:MAG: hypothetical protein VBE63_03250 [Lamprobacter sp.]|uniref:hypothetical protein n=1 Tax=Lamprobacter sp. TaxID=3100796 RepID=UPI002B25BC7D|nr:hypothetical protein [Lamprobacter sp.]MEA3638943.1 hypothetical protein [Lamprobacter sp.]
MKFKTSRSPNKRILLLLLGLAGMLGACASGPQVTEQEAYDGQAAAGILRPPGVQGALVQRRLVTELAASAAFAGLYPLDSPYQSTEAEILIEPVVIEAVPGRGGFEQMLLQVRAYRKHNSDDGFSQRYRGRASGNRDALDAIVKPLGNDLRRRFGAKPVY